MKKLPLISLVSFFILIPTITLAKEKNGYEYNEKEKTTSNNYYFFLEPSYVSALNTPRTTRNYTLFSKFTQTWLKVNPHEIELSNACKKNELKEELYDGEEKCWSYRRYYYILDKIASQGAIKASEAESSYYTRELKSGSNIYYDHGGYKQNLGDPWQNTITPDPSNVQEGKLIVEADASNIINSYKYRSLACSSVKTTNNVKLIDTEGNQIKNGNKIDDRSTIIEINREYDGTYTIGEPPSKENNSNCNGLYPTKDIDSSMYEYQNDVIYSPVLYNIKTTDVQKECISKGAPIKGTCNGTSNSSNIKCLKTIVSGNSKGEVKLDQTATLTNILTPTKIYQGGGIKLGFMYYNTVKWNFSEDEKYGDDSEIRTLLASKLKSTKEIENDITVEVYLKDENGKKYNIDNIQKKCTRDDDNSKFEEDKTVTTTCTFLLPKSIVDLGTGKVTYKNHSGQGINNEYYTPITYTGYLSLEAEIKNIGVLDEVDGWTDNWTLKYDGENDDSCKVNVTSRLYKPNQKNEYAFIYRPIDLNNPFPNRNAGVNWYDWYSIPANKERLKSSYSKNEYQVILDNQSVSKIKEYNKSNNYLDWTGINEKTGKSKFIERILEGGNP